MRPAFYIDHDVRPYQILGLPSSIQEVLDGVSTKYSQQLASLMTLNFQQFDDVSLMAA